jgi:hypothetical protein
MSRIRSIKPEFFRDEKLQDLEAENPGQHIMLFFAGLWTVADKEGRFEWKPRTLKLDILPFLSCVPDVSLMCLWDSGLIKKYKNGDKHYGLIVNFAKHQRITGKEGQEPAKYPEPIDFIDPNIGDTPGTHPGHTWDTIEITGREGKGREQEREQERGVGKTKSRQPLAKRSLSEFAQFWDSYPRKKAKASAEKAWEKINGIASETILAAVERDKISWRDQEMRYIPYPGTWLNQRRWDDDVDDGRSPIERKNEEWRKSMKAKIIDSECISECIEVAP